MKSLSYEEFEQNVKNDSKLSVIKFGATWCGPCRNYAPVLEEAAGELGEMAAFYDVDVDEAPELAAEFGVRGVPATFFIKDGDIINSFAGLQSKSSIVDFVKENQ